LLKDHQIFRKLNDAPAQPRLSRYPTKVQVKAKRSFHSAWYTGNNWLEYSQQEDAAFCYPCRHFTLPGSNPDKAFTAVGYSNWKKAMFKDGGFSSHCKSDCHVEAYVAWREYDKKDSRPSILQQLNDERSRQIQQNRQNLGAVVDVLKYTALHRLSLRGHDEGEESLNAGNFLDMLKLLGKYNDNIGKKLADLPDNAKYTSSDIQDEILSTMAKMVKTDIAEEVKKSGEFSVMADETKDVRKIEQMSIVLRYFLAGTVYESIVGFVPANVLTADGLSGELMS